MSKEVGHNLAGWFCSESFLRLQVKCWWKAVINRLDWSGRTHFQDEWITIYTYKLCSDFVSCILGLPWKPRKGKIIQISVPMYPESSFTRLTQRTWEAQNTASLCSQQSYTCLEVKGSWASWTHRQPWNWNKPHLRKGWSTPSRWLRLRACTAHRALAESFISTAVSVQQ